MFNKAKLKIIAWNLLLTFFINIFLNLVFYLGIMNAVSISTHRQQLEIDKTLQNNQIKLEETRIENAIITEVKERLIWTLVTVNFGLLFVTSVVTYFRTRKTLQPIKDMLEEQNRFISDSSHELKTPITAMKIALEVALMDKSITPNEIKRILQDNLKDVNYLHKLTNRLLTLTKFQSKNNQINLSNVDVSIALDNAIDKLRPIIKNKKQRLEVNLPINCHTYGNLDLLEELVVIILDNAIKYSPPKSIIKIYIEKQNRSFDLHIVDQGAGISHRDLPQLFNRFYRVDQSRTKTSIPGYGLGLPIAQKIVEIHQGKIWVKSEMDKGSDFIVQLPLK